MKKRILTAILICIMLSCFGCSKIQVETEEHTPGNCPEVYKEGIKYAVKETKDGAEGDWRIYVEVEELEDIIRSYFGDEAEEIRDMIIYHPDLKKYDASEIVEDAIMNSELFYYDKLFKE